jgi:hypothetical protein
MNEKSDILKLDINTIPFDFPEETVACALVSHAAGHVARADRQYEPDVKFIGLLVNH